MTRSDPNSDSRISLQERVSAVLARSAAVMVFMRHRMACPGCLMAPFMTVAEAAASYRLDPQPFLAELEAAIQETEE